MARNDGKTGDLRRLPLGQVQPDPHNIRTNSDKVKIDQLRESLEAALDRGEEYLNPITVYPVGRDLYRIKFGHRRYYASLEVAKSRPLDSLVFRVVPKPESESALLREQLEETLHQEGLNPIDLAVAVRRFKDLTGKSIRQLAQSLAEIGLDRDKQGHKRGPWWVTFHLALTELHPQVQRLIAEGKLAASTAYRLRALPPPQQVELGQRIVGEGMSRREVEQLTGPDADDAAAMDMLNTIPLDASAAAGALLPGGQAGAATGSDRPSRGPEQRASAVTNSLTIPVPPEDLASLPIRVQRQVEQIRSDKWGEHATDEQKAVARDAVYWGRRSVAEAEALADTVWSEWPQATEVVQGACVFMRRLLTQPRLPLNTDSALISLLRIYASELGRRLSSDKTAA